VSDEALPPIIEAVLMWYLGHTQGVRRKRIGTLLLEGENWAHFVETVRPILGDAAVGDPRPPQPTEIHL
jgi:hypothetical protein